MKLPVFTFIFSALISVASASSIPATSSITAATVYADRAVVTRSARVDLPAGESELTFPDLPYRIMENSVQVSGRGTTATILDVVARTTYIELTADPRLKTIEDELAALKREDRTLEDKLAIAGQQQALIAKIENSVTQPAPKDTASARPSFDDWQKLLAFSSENATRTAAERQSLEQQREELARKITATQARLDQIGGRGAGHRATKTVTVRVAAAKAGPLDLLLDYAVPGAAWAPDYTARLHSDKREIELTYFGLVINATGEDWNNVALTLSTARPNLGAGAPEPQPWILEALRQEIENKSSGFSLLRSKKPKRPEPSSTVLGPDSGLSGSALGMDGAVSEVADTTISLATLDTSVSSASFVIPVKTTILSDGTLQKVGISTATLAANLQYQATPGQLETAFLSASMTNTTDFPLLGGAVGTFLDNTFVATGQLKTVMPGEKFSLDLGADESVAIKRKLVKRFTEDTGLTSKSKRITYEFLLTVTNHKRTAERLVLKDVLPVSRDEKIVVKLLAPAEKEVGTKDKPGREVTREEDGKLFWRLDLKPGEKREIPLKFSIEHPADLSVTGLE
jgi:uncharacterized protein (TIGR02231 family)